MSQFVWPDHRGLLDDFADHFAEIGARLVIVSADDLAAGLARARLVEDYEPDTGLFALAALAFDGVATRHALLDGNKRLAWQAMTTFLYLNGAYLDAPEVEAAEVVLDVITHRRTVGDLATYLEAHCVPVEGE